MPIPNSLAEPCTIIQEIKCVIFNLNINGIYINNIPRGMTEDVEAQNFMEIMDKMVIEMDCLTESTLITIY